MSRLLTTLAQRAATANRTLYIFAFCFPLLPQICSLYL